MWPTQLRCKVLPNIFTQKVKTGLLVFDFRGAIVDLLVAVKLLASTSFPLSPCGKPLSTETLNEAVKKLTLLVPACEPLNRVKFLVRYHEFLDQSDKYKSKKIGKQGTGLG